MGTNSLVKFFPSGSLDLTKKEIKSVVASSTLNDVHTTYAKMKSFLALFEEEVKNHFLSVGKKLKAKDQKIVTDLGEITVVSRDNITAEEEKIEKYIDKNGIPDTEIFDIKYEVVTSNEKVLTQLMEKGYIVKTKKLVPKKLMAAADLYPKLKTMYTNTPTEYLKNL